MSKTALLLAFGAHNSKSGYDKKFNRDTVGNFIDEKVVSDGRNAIIITELLGYDIFPSAPKTIDQKIELFGMSKNRIRKVKKVIEREAKDYENRLNNKWKETRENGSPFMWRTLSLGFEPKVLAINSKDHGRIQNIVEPHSAEIGFEKWMSDLSYESYAQTRYVSREEKLGAMKKYVSHFLKSQIARVLALANKADKLRQENPDMAIIIPRGTSHRGMLSLFNENDYDISSASADYALDFVDELLANSYDVFPDSDTLDKVVSLQLDYESHFQRAKIKPYQLFLRSFGFSHHSERLLEDSSRSYAYSREELSSGPNDI